MSARQTTCRLQSSPSGDNSRQADHVSLMKWLAGVDEDANYLFQIPAATPKNPPQQRKRDRDRAERMRLAGGPMPSLREKAYAFARQRTIVRTSDFTAIGIPRHYLAWMCEEGWLVREGYGLYRAAEREAA